ncbi:MAG TPA: crossover junction endodeoxyribonuclease RuvC, partial [Acidimicrobiia bacterium]|nr:crossover junction endodeoxyribonuclease RuvC [Acidimicrobiia bacterium]
DRARSIEPMFDPGAVTGPESGPVLGIDPGLSRCGYGAVARHRAELRAVSAGVLRTAPDDPLPQRLAELEAELETLVDQLRPVAIAVERVLFQTNVRTAISVGQASGLALAVAARAQVPVVQYSPNEVKLAVAGDGRAGKEEVQRMVARMLRLPAVPEPPDAADALALALCHLWRDRVEVAVDAATTSTPRTGGFEARVAAAIARQDAR